MDEQQLVSGCKHAESWARKQVYERYAPVMLAICMRYVNDRDTARDLMHDGFIKVFTKINMYTGEGSFEGWMKRVVITTVLEYLRKKDAVRFSVPLEEYNDALAEIDPQIMQQLSANELMSCICELPKGYRTVFNLFALEGYSHKEIAEMLGIKESTSKTQFMRAKALLQKKVQSLLHDQYGR